MELKMSVQSRRLISIFEDTEYNSELESITSGCSGLWVGVLMHGLCKWAATERMLVMTLQCGV